MGLKRNNRFPVRAGWSFIHTHHTGLRRAIDIRIKQANFAPLFGQRHRKVGRNRGFPHAALTGGHNNNPIHARHASGAILFGRMTADLQIRGRLGLRGRSRTMGRQHNRGRIHTRQSLHQIFRRLADRFHLCGHIGIIGLNHKTHLPVVHGKRAHKIAADKIATIRQLNACKLRKNHFLVTHQVRPSSGNV